MSNIPFSIVNVFSSEPFGGNAMGIVPAKLEPTLMQKIAREFGFSATVFPVRTGDRSYSVRMFNPVSEIIFGGGASMAAAYAMGSGIWEQRSMTSVIKMEVDNNVAWGLQPVPQLEPIQDDEINKAIGLDDSLGAFVGRNLGNIHVLAVTRQRPSNFAPDAGRLAELSRRYGGSTIGAVYRQDKETLLARVFAPSHGLPEDPACGGGAAVIAKVMFEHFGCGSTATIYSGVEMGRPSQMKARIGADAISIGGPLRILARGTLSID